MVPVKEVPLSQVVGALGGYQVGDRIQFRRYKHNSWTYNGLIDSYARGRKRVWFVYRIFNAGTKRESMGRTVYVVPPKAIVGRLE